MMRGTSEFHKAMGGNKKMQGQECLPEEKHWVSREGSRESLQHYKLLKRLG